VVDGHCPIAGKGLLRNIFPREDRAGTAAAAMIAAVCRIRKLGKEKNDGRRSEPNTRRIRNKFLTPLIIVDRPPGGIAQIKKTPAPRLIDFT
jgi:hypothetical protein